MPKIILGIRLYSTEEVAELLGTTRGTLSKYTQDNRIASTMIGGKRYYSEENIKNFLVKGE